MDTIKRQATCAGPDTVCPDDIDAFITMGDNLYPVNATAPTPGEFQQMMDLFERRQSLKNLPIYAIRGNHDCYYPKDLLLDLAKEKNEWNMPFFYYSQQF
jgi:DNA repair exonuclease SbcCD nuclease subunit